MTTNRNSHLTFSSRHIRERVGLIVNGSNAAAAVKSIVVAEDAGVRRIWMAQPPNMPDALITFAAAAAKTSTINLGTSIVPTYTRHPLVLAQQALALQDLAPHRLRLGVGPSHRFQYYHRYLDFYAKIPFYVNMFSSAGFQINSEQVVPGALVDNLVVSGNEATVTTRLNELLGAGLDEIMASLVPIADAGDIEQQQVRLMQLIGRL
jgi:Luciferase-like monooxygenase